MSPRHGLSTAVHDQIDIDEANVAIYEICQRKAGGVIVDAFSGGGRDIQKIVKVLQGNGRFVAIDADPVRIEDMLAKDGFAPAKTQRDIEQAFAAAKIAVICGKFPEYPYGHGDIDLSGKADFVLCRAGIMFVSNPDEALAAMADMLSPSGVMFLEFSGERNDQEKSYGRTYFVHDEGLVQKILQQDGLKVNNTYHVPDTAGRPFQWFRVVASKSAQA